MTTTNYSDVYSQQEISLKQYVLTSFSRNNVFVHNIHNPIQKLLDTVFSYRVYFADSLQHNIDTNTRTYTSTPTTQRQQSTHIHT